MAVSSSKRVLHHDLSERTESKVKNDCVTIILSRYTRIQFRHAVPVHTLSSCSIGSIVKTLLRHPGAKKCSALRQKDKTPSISSVETVKTRRKEIGSIVVFHRTKRTLVKSTFRLECTKAVINYGTTVSCSSAPFVTI